MNNDDEVIHTACNTNNHCNKTTDANASSNGDHNRNKNGDTESTNINVAHTTRPQHRTKHDIARPRREESDSLIAPSLNNNNDNYTGPLLNQLHNSICNSKTTLTQVVTEYEGDSDLEVTGVTGPDQALGKYILFTQATPVKVGRKGELFVQTTTGRQPIDENTQHKSQQDLLNCVMDIISLNTEGSRRRTQAGCLTLNMTSTTEIQSLTEEQHNRLMSLLNNHQGRELEGNVDGQCLLESIIIGLNLILSMDKYCNTNDLRHELLKSTSHFGQEMARTIFSSERREDYTDQQSLISAVTQGVLTLSTTRLKANDTKVDKRPFGSHEDLITQLEREFMSDKILNSKTYLPPGIIHTLAYMHRFSCVCIVINKYRHITSMSYHMTEETMNNKSEFLIIVLYNKHFLAYTTLKNNNMKQIVEMRSKDNNKRTGYVVNKTLEFKQSCKVNLQTLMNGKGCKLNYEDQTIINIMTLLYPSTARTYPLVIAEQSLHDPTEKWYTHVLTHEQTKDMYQLVKSYLDGCTHLETLHKRLELTDLPTFLKKGDCGPQAIAASAWGHYITPDQAMEWRKMTVRTIRATEQDDITKSLLLNTFFNTRTEEELHRLYKQQRAHKEDSTVFAIASNPIDGHRKYLAMQHLFAMSMIANVNTIVLHDSGESITCGILMATKTSSTNTRNEYPTLGNQPWAVLHASDIHYEAISMPDRHAKLKSFISNLSLTPHPETPASKIMKTNKNPTSNTMTRSKTNNNNKSNGANDALKRKYE